MSYFPCDIPFMSDDELKGNGIRIPKDVSDTNVGDTIYRADAIDLIWKRREECDAKMEECLAKQMLETRGLYKACRNELDELYHIFKYQLPPSQPQIKIIGDDEAVERIRKNIPYSFMYSLSDIADMFRRCGLAFCEREKQGEG